MGCGERGKTTLLHRLRGISIENINRTVGIDIEPWTYGQPAITFITWDFAGQVSKKQQLLFYVSDCFFQLYRIFTTQHISVSTHSGHCISPCIDCVMKME